MAIMIEAIVFTILSQRHNSRVMVIPRLKFQNGELVHIIDYYDDMIPKAAYEGLVVDHERILLSETSEHVLYDVLFLTGDKEGKVERVEGFAMSLMEELNS